MDDIMTFAIISISLLLLFGIFFSYTVVLNDMLCRISGHDPMPTQLNYNNLEGINSQQGISCT